MTNQPHREWIYRQAYQMGRHVIGYEVQKVLAAVDWIEKQAGPDVEGRRRRLRRRRPDRLLRRGRGPADRRGAGQRLLRARGSASGPSRIYRNVWGLLREFGDAEIATLIAPRGLVVEHSEAPRVDRPARRAAGAARRGRGRQNSGRRTWTTFSASGSGSRRSLPAGLPEACPRPAANGGAVRDFVGPEAVRAFARLLGVAASKMERPEASPTDRRTAFDPDARQQRQVAELEGHVQRLLRSADATRNAFFLNQTTLIRTLAPRGERFRMFRVKEQSAEVFAREVRPLREMLRTGGDRPHRRSGPAGRSALAQGLRSRRSGPATR